MSISGDTADSIVDDIGRDLVTNEAGHAASALYSHTSGTGDVALNGLVVAGINNNVTITIDLGASAPTLSTTSPYSSHSTAIRTA